MSSYYREALDVLATSARSPRRSGKTLAASRAVEQEIAHAVALEREKCAALLDSKSDEQSALGWALKTVDENEQANACFGEANQLHLAAFAIRRGDHWKGGE